MDHTVKYFMKNISLPAEGYTAPDYADSSDVPVYAASDAVPTYEAAGDDPALAALASNIPGVPGEDYPIYAEVCHWSRLNEARLSLVESFIVLLHQCLLCHK